MKVQTNYKEGDLVKFKSQTGFEQNLGLIVQVLRNKLDQPQGYQVQIRQQQMLGHGWVRGRAMVEGGPRAGAIGDGAQDMEP